MDTASAAPPRILILEPDRKTCAALRRYAVAGWPEVSVQATSGSLPEAMRDGSALKNFDVVLAGCNFSADGGSAYSTLKALRALASDPKAPAVILLTQGGSEYTAVQAVKSGAFDCIPRTLLGSEPVLAAVGRALAHRRPPEDDCDGIKLLGYDIKRCITRHGKVSIHVAYSAEQARDVVLKVLHRGGRPLSCDKSFERFVAELKHLQAIDDAAVAHAHDFRVTSRYCYIAMEYFPAGHLGQRLGAPLPPAEALNIAVEIAAALSIIHAAGIVHRDLKPGNVMFREDGSLALIDFGLAESKDDAAATPADAAVAGTPYYMSPEQARGQPTDERTDLYALGVMLYQMLTGEKPYTGSSAENILEQHCE
ncbi:MAG TPA: protein kinase, partial [Gammaproteobacteria bacterium]|nr:protein kinase [Gammaproteobacteria bacterium]